MTIRVFVALALVSFAASATINKKDGYGGSSSYTSSGSSYDAAPTYVAQPAASYSSGTSYGSTGDSYSSGGTSSYGTSDSYGSSGGGGGGTGGSGDSYGNLYYYYYPVASNHSSPSSGSGGYSSGAVTTYGGNTYQSGGYGGGGGGASYGGGGGGGGSYYPPAHPPVSHDPFNGLASFFSAIDINSFILPALLIAGVALLLPAILNCDLQIGTCTIPIGTGRGFLSRSAGDDMTLTIPQAIDSAYKMYDAATTDSDQCLQRVVCEMGGMLRNMRGKDAIFSVLDYFASNRVKKQLGALKEGAFSSLDDDDSCGKFLCGKLDNKID